MSNLLSTNFLNNLYFTPTTLLGFGFKTDIDVGHGSIIYNKVTKNIGRSVTNSGTKIEQKRIRSFYKDREKNLIKNIKTAITVANVVNVLGYIPFVGRLIGAIRILATFATPLKRKQKIAHIIRGISELTGYNRIRLVIDLAATVFNFAKRMFIKNDEIILYYEEN